MSRSDRTIDCVVKDGLCLGCGTCAGMCPTGAIEMIADRVRGLYVPRLAPDDCVHCGLCYDICPGHSVDFNGICETVFGCAPTDALLGNYMSCQTGYTTDDDIRYSSASGGLVTSILIHAIEQRLIDGALVTRMNAERPLEPQPFLARTPHEIIAASKSKYCPVAANDVLREIRASSGRYAVVGLPCHIQGIRKAEMRDPALKNKIVARLGIACSCNWRFEAIDKVLADEGISPDQVTRLDYRGSGWPGKMTIALADGQTRTIPLAQFYGKLGHFPIRRCTLCSDHLCDLADLAFGDAWLPEIVKTDKLGTSFVLARSQCGRRLLEEAAAAGKIRLRDFDVVKMLQSQSNTLFKKRKLRARMVVLRLTGAKLPRYEQLLLRPVLRDYLDAVKYYLIKRIQSRQKGLLLAAFNLARSVKRKARALFGKS